MKVKNSKLLMVSLGATKHVEPNNGEYALVSREFPFTGNFDTTQLVLQRESRFDLKQVIEEVEPELIVYVVRGESQTSDHPKVVIPRNTDAYLEIPRVIFANADKISPLSSAGIMLGEDLGVEANFSTVIVDGEFDWLPFPSYYIPQSMWINACDFKDYKENTEFCIGMFGAGYFQDGFYPWRSKVVKNIVGKFPIVHYPQPENTGKKHLAYPRVVGEKYSRMINRCQFGIACGSVANMVLAKHFEIPASRTCLLTEDTPFLREHGFIDGENCVCVTPENVQEKIEYYLTNIEHLQQITDRGYEFVHRTWLAEDRANSLHKWYQLRRNLQKGEKISQTGILDFSIVKENEITERGLNRGIDYIVQSWMEGFKLLQQGEIQHANVCFAKTLSYVGYEPHGRLGMALVNLFSKNAKNCIAYLEAIFGHEQGQGGLEDYHDPVELAYYIIAAICLGDIKRAYGVSRMWTNHTHFALQAARVIAASAAKQGYDQQSDEKAISVHSRCPVIISSVDGWINHFRDIFKIYSINI